MFLEIRINITVMNSYLQKLSTWVTGKSIVSTKIDFLSPTPVTFSRGFMTYEGEKKHFPANHSHLHQEKLKKSQKMD